MIRLRCEFGYIEVDMRGDVWREDFIWDGKASQWCKETIGYVPKVSPSEPPKITFTKREDEVLFAIKFADAIKFERRIGLIAVTKDNFLAAAKQVFRKIY